MNTFQIFFGILFFSLCSCSFNRTFHIPARIPPFEELTQYESDQDTIYIEYIEANQEIILRDSDFKKLNQDYSITNKYFFSSNDNKLNGWLLTPKDKKLIATILHFHGSGGNLLTHYRAMAPLVKFGYQIFMFDYSGYGCSGGYPSHKTALQDGYSALEYLKSQINFDNGKIIIYGHSYGGYLASIIGSNSQDNINGIVMEGAFSSFKDEAKHKAGIFGNFVKEGIQADKEIRKNYKPVLIIHSREDKMVPIQLGYMIYNNANDPKEFYEIDGMHIKGMQNYSEEIANKIHRMTAGE